MSWFAQSLLGSDPHQRLFLVRYFYALGIYVFCAMLLFTGVALDLASGPGAVALISFIVLGQLGFYGALRWGFNRHFKDPSLTLPQMAFANVAVGLSYVSNPAARGMMSMLMAVVLVFGAFTLSPRYCRQLGWWCVATLGGALVLSVPAGMSILSPTVELFHLLLSSVVLIVISRLTGQLSALRVRQKGQKLELRQALEKLRLLATRDELTGLSNRRHALELLAQEERKSARSGTPSCFALIDIDWFKRINDTQGHQTGDDTLRRFAGILGGSLRPGDMLARWGGEEFLLLLPGTPLEQARQVMERLRERCATPENWQELAHLNVTFSAGLAAHLADETAQQSIARADSALYRAKAAGRNRVELA
ncbi:MAG: GGDEF domain-containing protein [Burkholderiales bacterium PBB4]|nr:MAG: GGDEF domain-containing protein [Burkholderiales bacterium PBB4]